MNGKPIIEQPVGFSKPESIIFFSVNGDFSGNEKQTLELNYIEELNRYFSIVSDERKQTSLDEASTGIPQG